MKPDPKDMMWPELRARLRAVMEEPVDDKHAGARAPILVEVKVHCLKTGITAVIMRPGYKTPQRGEVRCPHCYGHHPYVLDYDPTAVYQADAPKLKE